MKRLLNTLYVTTQGAYLSREGETVLVRVEHETKLRLPIHTLTGIVCFGQVSASPALMGLCGERHVLLSFLTERGAFLARVQGPVSGNVLLRREQYRRADSDGRAAEIARSVVVGKLANCRTVAMRAARELSDTIACDRLRAGAAMLGRIMAECERVPDVDGLRGKEGEGAKIYFGIFDDLIAVQKDSFFFRQRSRRPPLDNMNALLSFLYTLLAHDVQAALEGVGLDPAVGFLHKDRPGRPSLALDMMEEFRPVLCDRLALALINRKQVQGSGFRKTESGAIMMDDDTRREVLIAFQKRKKEELVHPFLEEKLEMGLLPHVQAMLLARYIRGDLDAYPPFLWR